MNFPITDYHHIDFLIKEQPPHSLTERDKLCLGLGPASVKSLIGLHALLITRGWAPPQVPRGRLGGWKVAHFKTGRHSTEWQLDISLPKRPRGR